MTVGSAPVPPFVVALDDDRGLDVGLVGGKAINLARLVRAGFLVPPGFTVSTAAYREFLVANELARLITSAVARIDFADPESLEPVTKEIRDAFLAAEVPERIGQAIIRAYRDIPDGSYVAVRSSGTAEDLADASFAGLHDTYLDVSGDDGLLQAVKSCWSSLWSARSTAYRNDRGYDHVGVGLAVTVQRMVEAEAAGVLFTANPLSARTDEFVINAAWGLGEGVVSGVLTPDQFVLDSRARIVKSTILGSKAVRIVRNPESGVGTVEEPVPGDLRASASISDAVVRRLGELASRVLELYDGVPQDVEFALERDEIYVLQSRSITGVDFTWDEDVDAWQSVPEDPKTIWSHAYADEYWTGAITPLFYSVRGEEYERIDRHSYTLWGLDDLLLLRPFKWAYGTVYYNAERDRLLNQYLLPASLRESTLWKLPPSWQKDAARAPFDWRKAARAHLRILLREPRRRPGGGWYDDLYDEIENHVAEADGPSDAELCGMSDEELRASTQRMIDLAVVLIGRTRPAFHYYAVAAMALLKNMVAAWCPGLEAEGVFQQLIGGKLPRATSTSMEAAALRGVAAEIRANPELTHLIESTTGAEFFQRLEESAGGRRLLKRYTKEVLEEYGHRGHADRDIWYPRRADDPGIDHETLRVLVAVDEPTDGHVVPASTRCEVAARIRRTRLGVLKVKAFERLHDYILRLLLLRDDFRPHIDRVTFAKKRHFREIGRRLKATGKLEHDDDFYFLTREELYYIWDREAVSTVDKAKIATRRRVFEGHLAHEHPVPAFLQHGKPLAECEPDTDGRVLQGIGTSRGCVTGTARIARGLDQIGRLRRGDILVCNSTDPGWASVFTIVGGLVLETGGMLAHGSCLAREYGLPAVTLRAAMTVIQEGETITVDGDVGVVRRPE